MPQPLESYLDIESTGLYPAYNQITVVGVYLTNGVRDRFAQLVGDNVTAENLLDALQGASTIYTYNGTRFDLPFIRHRLGVDLARMLTHCDLMFHCWRQNLYGGLKGVERQLGICRQLREVDGYEAVRLWWQYANHSDEAALKKLLDYNREDVMNLTSLKQRLLPTPTRR